ncbi:hypothetical protein R6Q59_033559 [Mikania micrantha]
MIRKLSRSKLRILKTRRRLLLAKAGHYEKEAQKLKKLVKDNDTAHKLKMSSSSTGFCEIGIPEIALMYQLRTHGSSRFALQRRSGAPVLVPGVTLNEDEWRNRFFFVKRSSIPDGELLPLKWVEKESTFDLEDLNAFFAVKKEKTSPVAPKSRAMTTRSSKTAKKRKGVDTVDLEDPSDISVNDLLNKALVKYASVKEQFDKQIEDLEDQKKIITAKAGHYEKEVAKVKKQMKEMEASYKLQFKEHIEGAKKSAAIAVLRAKIQMANQAKTEGTEIWAKNLREWGKILAGLAGDKAEASTEVTKAGDAGETSMVGEGEATGAGTGVDEKEVMVGDDDNGAKV